MVDLELVGVVLAEVLLEDELAVAYNQQAVDVADLAILADGRDELLDTLCVNALIHESHPGPGLRRRGQAEILWINGLRLSGSNYSQVAPQKLSTQPTQTSSHWLVQQ